MPLLGLILAIVAISKIDKSHGQLTGKTMAIVAIPLSLFMMIAGIGMLTAIAIPNFIRYQLRSKTSEAKMHLRAIGTAAEAYYAENRRFPAGETGWVPNPACPPGKRCAVAPELWKTPPWSELGFSPSSATQYYQLKYSASGSGAEATFTAEAQADLDGDGELGHFKITGSASPDGSAEVDPVVDVAAGKF